MRGPHHRKGGVNAHGGNLTFDELQKAVGAGEIDTVVVCFPDMQGRLVGKRFQAEYFLDGAYEETHGCDYLLANDIDMEPVPGYAVANWEKGYGDFVMKPDLATLRRIPWLPATALVLCDVLDHHTHEPVAHSPRAMLQQADRAARRDGHVVLLRLGARVLSVRRDLRVGRGESLARPQDGRQLYPGLSRLPDHQGGGRDAGDPQRPAGRRHSGRELQGRMGPGPGGDQCPLRRSPHHGRLARHPQERLQGDRLRPRQGGDLHGQMALRPRRLVEPYPRLAVGRRRQEAAVPRSQRPSTACRP